MDRYTAKQVCEALKISRTRLSEYTNGKESKRKGRVEWSTPAILSEGVDFEHVIERGRSKAYYFPSAIEKIRTKRGEGKPPEDA